MRHVLLDTNVLVDFFTGDPDTVEAFRRSKTLALNTIVLGEVLAGFAAVRRPEANRRLLSRFMASPRVKLLPLDRETAEHYSEIYSRLRHAGTPIPSNDMWIAASALEHGLVLLTRDGHFREIAGLLTASSVDQLLP
jgi:tRNA(fMet)-specific endonuclease VapC